MRTWWILLASSLVLAFSTVATAAEFVIDLAQSATDLAQSATNRTILVGSGPLEITLIHRIPTAKYTVECHHDQLLVDPLPNPFGAPQATALAATAEEQACNDLETRARELAGAVSEATVADRVGDVNRLLGLCKPPAGKPDEAKVIEALKTQARSLVEKTTAKKVCSAEIAAADTLRVVVGRTQHGDRTWTYEFKEPSPGVWFPTYGFTFVPNKDQRVFTRAVPDQEGKFEILEKRDNQDLDFVPTVLFNYMPRAWRTRGLSWSVVGGLGIDPQDDLTVLLGFAAVIHQNLSIVGGLAMHQRQRLDGRYDLASPIIGEDLSEDQLTETTFKANGFVGIAFRFGSRPQTHDPPKAKE